jgi:hypothetical protein
MPLDAAVGALDQRCAGDVTIDLAVDMKVDTARSRRIRAPGSTASSSSGWSAAAAK